MAYSIIILVCWLFILLIAQRQFVHIALLGFPGVILHESMHFIVGLFLFAKPTSVNLIPRRAGNRWQFGSVTFTGLNVLNAAPVAYAPLLLLVIGWHLFHHWLVPLVISHHYLEGIVAGYIIASALFSSAPSPEDIKVGGFSTLFWVAVALSGWWFWSLFAAETTGIRRNFPGQQTMQRSITSNDLARSLLRQHLYVAPLDEVQS